jgi:hypothetical protein
MKITLTISKFVFFLFLFGTTVNTSAKTIYYVKQNATGNGSSWANAAGNIQTMIDKAVSGDEVWVGKGTYYPTKIRDPYRPTTKTFLLKDQVSLYGGFSGSETETSHRELMDLDNNKMIESWEFKNPTVFSGDIDNVPDIWTKKILYEFVWWWTVTGNEGNCSSVVTGGLYFIGVTIFDGFTVENGNSKEFGGGIDAQNNLTVQNCTINKCTAAKGGGGIYCINSSIKKCKITNCESRGGGGIKSSGIVSGCRVNNCSGAGINGAGILNCEISDCSGSGIVNCGAVNSKIINCVDGLGGGASSSSLKNCEIRDCRSTLGGGGIYMTGKNTCSYCFISNCYSSGNGGGIYSLSSEDYTIINTTVTNCTSTKLGGGIYWSASKNSYVYNCAVMNCLANDDGGGIYCENSYSNINYCAASNNKVGNTISNYLFGSQINNITPELKLTFENPTTFCGVAINDNQKLELLYANWHLREGSPCINVGIKKDIYNKSTRYGNIDIGAYEYDKSIPIPVFEHFNSCNNFDESEVFYRSDKMNTTVEPAWIIKNQKAIFLGSLNLNSNYSKPIFTYIIDASDAPHDNVLLRYDLYFEAASGGISPLGTEVLKVEYSRDFINWWEVRSYSNQNGTISNRTNKGRLTIGQDSIIYLRFTAKGENSNRIGKWEIDNVIIDIDGSTTTDLKIVEKKFLKYSLTNGVLQIHNLNNVEILQLFDLNGRQLFNYKPTTYPIQLQLPNRGVYIVRTQSDVGVTNQKVVWE